ncbi:MAG: gspG [Candidatus Adlerbacteria bacterium]|nr:gspG [Candidatus Adlerbacteria bacterium]
MVYTYPMFFHTSSARRNRGFTLIELLTVIAIIGILASIVVVSLSTARAKGRDGKRIADLRSIQLAVDLYYNDNTKYPINVYASSGGLTPNYMAVVPTDPSHSGMCSNGQYGTSGNEGCYMYSASNGITSGGGNGGCGVNTPAIRYHLGTTLEDSTNSALTQDVDQGANAIPGGGTITPCNQSPSDFDGTSALVYDLTN